MQQHKVEWKKTIVEESQDNWIEKNEVDETKTQLQEHHPKSIHRMKQKHHNRASLEHPRQLHEWKKVAETLNQEKKSWKGTLHTPRV